MKTANEMLAFCENNQTDAGTIVNRNLKHFQLIESELKNNEIVIASFTGLMNGFNNAFAITQDRIIMAHKKLIGAVTKSIYHKNINDISIRTGPLHGFIKVDTFKETFEFCVVAKNAKSVYNYLHSALDKARGAQDNSGYVSVNSADEIMKYKQLLDAGAITQEEYENKKRQLLNMSN